MSVSDVFEKIRRLDEALEHYVVPSSRIIPLGGQKVQIDGEDRTWSIAAAQQVRQRFSVPEEFENRLPSYVVQPMWQALIQHEASLPPISRRMPERLRVAIQGRKVIGFSDASLVTLRNSQVIEAVETATKQLPMHEAEVECTNELKSDAWQLKILFPFKRVEPRVGDIVQGGISVRFSSVGLHPVQVRNWLRRLWCDNGSSIPICVNNKQVRIRRRQDKQFADQDVIGRIQKIIEQGVRELDAKLKAVAGLANKPIDARRMIAQIAQQNRLRKSVTKRLLEALGEDEGGKLQGKGSRYDVWNAITRVASHESEAVLRNSVRERLSVYSGCFSQQDIHFCPTCRRILEPSHN